MLLAVNVGNTNIKLGLFEGPTLIATFRLRTKATRTAEDYVGLLASLLVGKGLSLASISAAAMASVVPSTGEVLCDAVRRHLRVAPLVVTGDAETGMAVQYHPPGAVGADRIVNAFAARALFGAPAGAPCVVVDYGTAISLDAVSAAGAYLGGAIMPGIGIALDALVSRAALLSAVELAPTGAEIGTNTPDALRSGTLLGCAAQTDGVVARFVQLLGEATRVIATGGLAPLIAPLTSTIEVVDPHLTLTGLRLLHERAEGHRNRVSGGQGGGEG